VLRCVSCFPVLTEHVHSIGQGKARHGKYQRCKPGGGQAYDHSGDQAAVVA
jgi:hypothetical protein